ncbi:MAG TPA: trigger factor [Candidatus Cybelea sp.]|nr:trigger factor [Candidatus Cybelea sp.]
MQVTETNTSGLKREFKIVVPAGDLKAKVDTKLVELGQRVKLDGFRPGKVPMQVLKKRYERDVFRDVVSESVNEGSHQLMHERNLRPAGQPKVEIVKLEDGADLEFNVAMEIIPDIKPMDFKAIKLERVKIAVPDAEVDERLALLAKRSGGSEPATEDHAAAKGDVVVIDFVGKVGGEAFEGGSAEGHYLELGSGMFIPGFEDQLIGIKKGEKRAVKVTFPADYANTDLAGKDAEFDVTATEIRAPKATAVDDELAKSLGLADLAELKKQTKERMEREYGTVSRARVKRKLLDVLADNHDFTLPEGLVDIEFAAIWRQIEEDKKADRLDEEDKGKSDEQLKQEYREIALRRVKLGLLLSEVGRQSNLDVPQDELTRAVIAEARRYPGQEKQVIDFYQRSPEALNQLRAPLYEEKVVDFILEQAEVSERVVTPDQFAEEGKEELAAQKN